MHYIIIKMAFGNYMDEKLPGIIILSLMMSRQIHYIG